MSGSYHDHEAPARAEETETPSHDSIELEATFYPSALTLLGFVVLLLLLAQLLCQIWFATWVIQKLSAVEAASTQATIAQQRVDIIELKLNNLLAQMPQDTLLEDRNGD